MKKSERLARLELAITGAAALARQVAPLWKDQRDAADGWLIHYAVDVDVIMLHLNPEKESKYAAAFPGLDEVSGTQELLARRLGEYLMQELPGTFGGSITRHDVAGIGLEERALAPLLLIPPHAIELDRVLLRLQAEAKAGADEINNELTKLGLDPSRIRNLNELTDELIRHALATVTFLSGGSGATAALDRFGRLRGRLLNLRRYNGVGGAFPRVPIGGDASYAEFFDLFVEWRQALMANSADRGKRNIATDAWSLASIQFINRRIEKDRRRLILITGSEKIFQAAEAVRGGETAFQFAYLRHPIAAAGRKDFFRARSMENEPHRAEFRLLEWLNLFFPTALYRDGPQGIAKLEYDRLDESLSAISKPAALRELATVLSLRSKDASAEGDVISQWCSQVRSVGIHHELSMEANLQRLRELIESVGDVGFSQGKGTPLNVGALIEGLRRRVQVRISNSLRSIYVDTGWLAIIHLRIEGTNQQQFRGLPALRFEPQFSIAQRHCARLFDVIHESSHHGHEIDLATIYEDLRTLDDINYHAMLVHGLVYAATGNWGATHTLSLVALDAARELPDELKNGRLGREAAYLHAIATRRLARESVDLESAREFLQLARSLENPGAAIDPRFVSEELAQDCAEIQFRLFAESEPARIAGVAADLNSRFDAWWAIGFKLATVDAMQFERVQDDHPMQRWIQRQAATNCLLLAILQVKFNPDSKQRLCSDAMSLARKFSSWGLAPTLFSDTVTKSVYQDVISDFIYAVAIAIFSKDRELKSRAYLLAEASIPSTMMPLDTIRFPQLKELAAVHAT